MFWCFDEPFSKRLQKVVQFLKKHEKSLIWLKTLQLFEQTTMSLHFNQLFRKKLQKVPHFVKKHEKSSIWPNLYNFSKKLPCLCISMNFSGKSCKKCLISWKSTKNHRSGKNFATFRTNYHVFAFWWTFQKKVAKSASLREKTREIIDLAKTCNFSSKLRCLDIFMNFSERSCKKCLISWKSTRNHRFCQKLQLFEKNTMFLRFDELYGKKLKNCLTSWKSTKTHRVGQNYPPFSNKLPCFGVSMNFSAKVSKKLLNSWERRKNHRFGQNFATFRTNYHVFAFRSTFQKKVAKSAPFREKPREIIDLAKTLQLFEQTTMSLHFYELFSKNLQKVAHFVKKHEKPSIWPKLATFQEKVAKSASFREKARETIDLAKTFNFSSKLPCLGIFMNFSARSCKKCLIPWKSTRNHRFGQNYATFLNKLPCPWIWINFSGKSWKKCLISWNSTKNHWFGQSFATFGTSYNVFFLLMNFQEKSSKSASSREKARKIIDFVNLQLSEKTTMFWRFHEHCTKKLQKPSRALKKHEKSSIWPNLCNFSNKLRCFCISMNFQGKSCQKCFVSWKSTNNHRFAKTLQLFEQTTMFWHFDEVFSKKLQKVPRFVKKHEKSSIWPKLPTFRTNYHVLAFRWTFQQKTQKVARFVKKHEHSSIWPKLGTSRRNYHVLAFRWLLQEKIAKRWKKWLISWKMTKNHRFGLDLQVFDETTMFRRFCQLFSKKWVISWKSTKNRHSEVA